MAAAIYLHVPFCVAKCRYCDFYSAPFDGPTAMAYVRAAGMELQSNASHLSQPPRSIFVGGGTPTSLGHRMLGRLLEALAPYRGSETEFTVEANPGTIDPVMAATLAEAGVNRVSLGVQSFHDDELAALGRIHTADQAHLAVALLRQAGLANIGIDLMYALPRQTMHSWRESLAQAAGLGASHLSCYALSFEPQTPLGKDLAAGRAVEMDESMQKDLYYAAIESAEAAGMEHYEISNFASAGRRCVHNLTYWRNESYLGIGPAAASYINGERRTNHSDLQGYLATITDGRPAPAGSESLSGRRLMAETAMLGLRMTEGLCRQAFESRFSQDILSAFPRSTSRYIQLGALEASPQRLAIAKPFLFVADTILADIVAEA
ncbi:MAG: radical SAM family heme chaperone HemW [Phycisphaerae bacterium]